MTIEDEDQIVERAMLLIARALRDDEQFALVITNDTISYELQARKQTKEDSYESEFETDPSLN